MCIRHASENASHQCMLSSGEAREHMHELEEQVRDLGLQLAQASCQAAALQATVDDLTLQCSSMSALQAQVAELEAAAACSAEGSRAAEADAAALQGQVAALQAELAAAADSAAGHARDMQAQVEAQVCMANHHAYTQHMHTCAIPYLFWPWEGR